MRSSLLFALALFLAWSPFTRAESPKDGRDLFLAALEKIKLGEKAEREGNLDLATKRLEEAARMFDKVPANERSLMPSLIKLSYELLESCLRRVEVATVMRRLDQARANRPRESKEEGQFSIIFVHTLSKTGFMLVSDQP